MRSPIQTRYEDLPEELPIFPLSGALLLPWGRLPLNIFEPRYLNMTLDALGVGRIIGMVQPNYDREDMAGDPPVYSVGCAGRIASFEETEDGRLLILLKGLCRFSIVNEIEGRKGYRRVKALYEPFKADLDQPANFEVNREQLFERLKPYLEAHAMPLGVEVLKGLSDPTLVTSLCMVCPFDPREKQALLEAPTLKARYDALLALLQIAAFEAGGIDTPRQ
ncbi:MAG: LON peptidase substrate-binding domain-containing protein [Rhodospirillaceae bacterium]|nr:LON peptidase substrate-binding domain-containing protein [Rhodospirillaceae bacterium]